MRGRFDARSDHVNLTFDNPLVGPTTNHPTGFGSGLPVRPNLIDEAAAVARRQNFAAHQGVYGCRRPEL